MKTPCSPKGARSFGKWLRVRGVLFARLVYEGHFFKQMVGVSDLVDDEEDVADVKGDVSADLRIEDDVAHCALPHAVEVETD